MIQGSGEKKHPINPQVRIARDISSCPAVNYISRRNFACSVIPIFLPCTIPKLKCHKINNLEYFIGKPVKKVLSKIQLFKKQV